jgi:hypothetical protein
LERAAAMLKVSRRIVVDAKTVIKTGDTELINAVKAGETSVHKAAGTVRRVTEDTRPAPEQPKPEPFQPADVMVQMRMDAPRLSGAALATLIAEWIMARVEVSVMIGSRAEVMAQLGGGVAARSSISKWVRDDDVLDSQRASLVKETIAAMNPVERNKLIEEIAGGVAPLSHEVPVTFDDTRRIVESGQDEMLDAISLIWSKLAPANRRNLKASWGWQND